MGGWEAHAQEKAGLVAKVDGQETTSPKKKEAGIHDESLVIIISSSFIPYYLPSSRVISHVSTRKVGNQSFIYVCMYINRLNPPFSTFQGLQSMHNITSSSHKKLSTLILYTKCEEKLMVEGEKITRKERAKTGVENGLVLCRCEKAAHYIAPTEIDIKTSIFQSPFSHHHHHAFHHQSPSLLLFLLMYQSFFPRKLMLTRSFHNKRSSTTSRRKWCGGNLHDDLPNFPFLYSINGERLTKSQDLVSWLHLYNVTDTMLTLRDACNSHNAIVTIQ